MAAETGNTYISGMRESVKIPTANPTHNQLDKSVTTEQRWTAQNGKTNTGCRRRRNRHGTASSSSVKSKISDLQLEFQ